MSRSSKTPTLVVTDSDQLSALADAILAKAGGPGLTKNTVLNLIAGTLLGPKTNWGGLKARRPLVVASRLERARQLLRETASQEDIPASPVIPDDPNYVLEATRLVLLLRHPATGEIHRAAVSILELPALEAALFGPQAVGRYGAMSATFEVDGEAIRVSSQLFDGAVASFRTPHETLRSFLAVRRARILDTLLDAEPADGIHGAFISVAESQGEDILFDAAGQNPVWEEAVDAENASANAVRLDRACREATWAFLAEAAFIPGRRQALLRCDGSVLIDAILDDSWVLLSAVLRDDLARETGSPA